MEIGFEWKTFSEWNGSSLKTYPLGVKGSLRWKNLTQKPFFKKKIELQWFWSFT